MGFHVYYDPTEARVGTRLSQSVIDSGRAVENLEQYTGADLLLTTDDYPLTRVTDAMPHQLGLKKCIAAGLLVQRKSGGDFIGSLHKLNDILVRMLEWTDTPWLLITGRIDITPSGDAVMDGRETGWGMQSVIGYLDWWQVRGGYVTTLPSDDHVARWLNMWEARFRELRHNPVKALVNRTIKQVLTGPDWKDTLATLPGIGGERARRVATTHKRLASSMVWLTDLSDPTTVEGVASGTKEKVRAYLGLESNETLRIERTNGQ